MSNTTSEIRPTKVSFALGSLYEWINRVLGCSCCAEDAVLNREAAEILAQMGVFTGPRQGATS